MLFDISIFQLVIMTIINLVLFGISAISKSECDTIRFKPEDAWYQTEFWLSNKDAKKRSKLFKYWLSFLWDGWHLMDSTRNTCLTIILLMPYIVIFSIAWYWILLFIVLWYMIYGGIFELFYQN